MTAPRSFSTPLHKSFVTKPGESLQKRHPRHASRPLPQKWCFAGRWARRTTRQRRRPCARRPCSWPVTRLWVDVLFSCEKNVEAFMQNSGPRGFLCGIWRGFLRDVLLGIRVLPKTKGEVTKQASSTTDEALSHKSGVLRTGGARRTRARSAGAHATLDAVAEGRGHGSSRRYGQKARHL